MPADDSRHSSPPPRTRLFLTSPTGDLYLRPTAQQRNVPSSGCKNLDEVIERALRGIAETSEEVMRKKAAQVHADGPASDLPPSCDSSTPRLDGSPGAYGPPPVSPTLEAAWESGCRVFMSIAAGPGGVASRSDLVRGLRCDATVVAFFGLPVTNSKEDGPRARVEQFFQSLDTGGGGDISLQEFERWFVGSVGPASAHDEGPMEVAVLQSPAEARAEDDCAAPPLISEWEEDSGRRESVESRGSSMADEARDATRPQTSNAFAGAGVDLQLLHDSDEVEDPTFDGSDLQHPQPKGSVVDDVRDIVLEPPVSSTSDGDGPDVQSIVLEPPASRTSDGDQPKGGSKQHALRRQRSFPAYLEERTPPLEPQDAPVAAEWQEDNAATVQFVETDRGPGTRRRGTMFPSRLLSDSESEDDMAAAVAFAGQDSSDDEAAPDVRLSAAGPSAADSPGDSGLPRDPTSAARAAPSAPDSPARGVRWADDDATTELSTAASTGSRVTWEAGGGRRGTAMPSAAQLPADSDDEAPSAPAAEEAPARPARRGTAMPPAHARQADPEDPSEDSASNTESDDEESFEPMEKQPRRASSFPTYVDAPQQQEVVDDQSEASDRSLSADEVRTVLKRTSMLVSAPALDDGE